MRNEALDKYFADLSGTEFAYGKHDCFLFAAGVIGITSGVNPMDGLPPYGCEASAVILLTERWGTAVLHDVFLAVAKERNAIAVPLAEMADGDIVCIKWPPRLYRPGEIDQSVGLGVVYDGEVWAATPRGVMPMNMRLPLLDAWRFLPCQ